MNVTEAHHVNVLLAWICQRPRGRNSEIPHHDQALEAAVQLAERAHARLGAGIDLTGVRDRWPTRVTHPAEAEFHELREDMEIVTAAVQAWEEGAVTGRDALGVIRDQLNRAPIPADAQPDVQPGIQPVPDPAGDDRPAPTARERFEASVAESVAEVAAAERARHKPRDDAVFDAFVTSLAGKHGRQRGAADLGEA